MAAVVTSIDSTSGEVVITFAAPSSIGSSAILYYTIEIANKAGTVWTEDTTNCDGSLSSIMTSMTCSIPMDTLTASPYSYVFDDLVVARVSATNAIDTSTVSPSNTAGARIRSKPLAAPTPTLTSRTDASITVSWSAISAPNDGNSDITAYVLLWDDSTGTID